MRKTRIKNLVGKKRIDYFLGTEVGKFLSRQLYRRIKFLIETKYGKNPKIHHKARHSGGMDLDIYQELLKRKIKANQDRFLFVRDTCENSQKKQEKFFHKNCTPKNTRNVSLKNESLNKKTLAQASTQFGFGKYLVTTESELHDDQAKIFKGNAHRTGLNTKKREKETKVSLINPNITIQYYLEQPNPTDPDKKDEINVYVVKDLKKDIFHFHGLLITYPKTVVNRKTVDVEQHPTPIDQILSTDEIKNFENYLRTINFDYGRIEMIRDKTRWLCIIDVNNSPGKGPLTDANYPTIADIFQKIMTG